MFMNLLLFLVLLTYHVSAAIGHSALVKILFPDFLWDRYLVGWAFFLSLAFGYC